MVTRREAEAGDLRQAQQAGAARTRVEDWLHAPIAAGPRSMRMTKIRTHSTPSPRPSGGRPSPRPCRGQGTGELDEANDLAHQCVLVTTQATPMIAALFGLPMTDDLRRFTDRSTPPLQPDTFEQPTHVAADPRLDIEIVGARLAGLGELAFQALKARRSRRTRAARPNAYPGRPCR
jgi:hypothetical protein